MTNSRPFDAAGHLRTQFDRSFTIPPADRATGHRDFVVIEVAGRPFALPTASLSSVQRKTTLMPVPSTAAALLGIAGVRSAIIPVFSLRMLLGRAMDAGTEVSAAAPEGDEGELAAETWFALCEIDDGVAGLAFDRVVTYRRVAPGDIFAGSEAVASASPATSDAIRLGQELCPVLDMGRLRQQILAGDAQAGAEEAHVTAQVTRLSEETRVKHVQEPTS